MITVHLGINTFTFEGIAQYMYCKNDNFIMDPNIGVWYSLHQVEKITGLPGYIKDESVKNINIHLLWGTPEFMCTQGWFEFISNGIIITDCITREGTYFHSSNIKRFYT